MSFETDSYAKKPEDYFSGVRADIIQKISDRKSLKILEVGCGLGGTGALALRNGIAAEYDAIELDEKSAEVARPKLTNVYNENVDQFDFNTLGKTYDCLILSEVMEHLAYPWLALERIAPLLAPGALVFASSPNIASIGILKALIRGQFRYTEWGVMDVTHLRWFTPGSFMEMFEDAGFCTDKIGPVGELSKGRKAFNILTFEAFSHLTWNQILYEGHYSQSKR